VLNLGLPVAVLALLAGAEGQPPLAAPQARPGDLQVSVTAENVGTALVVKGTIKNKRSKPVTVGRGACFSHNVRIRLYRSPDRKAPAAWENPQEICVLMLLVTGIPPHGSISPPQMAGEVSGGSLPDSVPDGTYFATADFHLAGGLESGELAAGSIVVARHAPEIIVAPFGTPASP
jgi:hypothetical protein